MAKPAFETLPARSGFAVIVSIQQETDMSFLDKLAAAILPGETDEERMRARHAAISRAREGDWLHRAIEHHRDIEALFAEAMTGSDRNARRAAIKRLGHHLNAHAMAEEVVLYPAIARCGDKSDAADAYEEQAMAKIKMAKLETLDPQSDEWRDELKEIRDAIAHHVYEEEAEWFPQLADMISADESAMLTARYVEEYEQHGDVARDTAFHASRQKMPPPASGPIYG